MVFNVSGFEFKKKYSIFVHIDKNGDNIFNRLGILPLEPYIFSSAQNHGNGPGITREGFSAPKFESTAITYEYSGQVFNILF
jgi:uncharacterized protein (DUF2141 family)